MRVALLFIVGATIGRPPLSMINVHFRDTSHKKQYIDW